MIKLTKKEFEKIVGEGIKAIPEKFLQKLSNVAIVIEAEPTPAQKNKLNPVRSADQILVKNNKSELADNSNEINPASSAETSNGVNIHQNFTLLGLYEGVSQTRRGSNYSAVLPDKITIFQNPIEAAARDEKDIKEIVKNTVWHEIAHHFGMDEAEVRQAEAKRQKVLG